MKNIKLTTLTMVVVLLVSVLCGYTYAEAAVKLNTNKITITEGETANIKLGKIKPNKKITWKSSNKKVATVRKNSKKQYIATITAVNEGTTVITARVYGKSYRCKVTVEESQEYHYKDKIEFISKLRKNNISLTNQSKVWVGDVLVIGPKAEGALATYEAINDLSSGVISQPGGDLKSYMVITNANLYVNSKEFLYYIDCFDMVRESGIKDDCNLFLMENALDVIAENIPAINSKLVKPREENLARYFIELSNVKAYFGDELIFSPDKTAYFDSSEKDCIMEILKDIVGIPNKCYVKDYNSKVEIRLYGY